MLFLSHLASTRSTSVGSLIGPVPWLPTSSGFHRYLKASQRALKSQLRQVNLPPFSEKRVPPTEDVLNEPPEVLTCLHWLWRQPE